MNLFRSENPSRCKTLELSLVSPSIASFGRIRMRQLENEPNNTECVTIVCICSFSFPPSISLQQNCIVFVVLAVGREFESNECGDGSVWRTDCHCAEPEENDRSGRCHGKASHPNIHGCWQWTVNHRGKFQLFRWTELFGSSGWRNFHTFFLFKMAQTPSGTAAVY